MHEPCVLTVGNFARVRRWEDMEAEYGLAGYGINIAPSWEFPVSMREWCGKEVRIISVEEHTVEGKPSFYSYEVEIASSGERIYTTFTSYDLEYIDAVGNSELDECAADAIVSLFGGTLCEAL